MTPPPIQFKVLQLPGTLVIPTFAVDVRVAAGSRGTMPLTRADLETGVSLRATCECRHGFTHEGFVTPQGLFAKSWRPPLAWDLEWDLKWEPLMTLDGADGATGWSTSLATFFSSPCHAKTDFGALTVRHTPGHPHTPGNGGLVKLMDKVRRKGVRYALIKGNEDTFFDDGETTRNTIMLVHEAALPAAKLAALRAALTAAIHRRRNGLHHSIALGGQVLVLPPAYADAVDAIQAAGAALGALAVDGGDDEDAYGPTM